MSNDQSPKAPTRHPLINARMHAALASVYDLAVDADRIAGEHVHALDALRVENARLIEEGRALRADLASALEKVRLFEIQTSRE